MDSPPNGLDGNLEIHLTGDDLNFDVEARCPVVDPRGLAKTQRQRGVFSMVPTRSTSMKRWRQRGTILLESLRRSKENPAKASRAFSTSSSPYASRFLKTQIATIPMHQAFPLAGRDR